MSGFFENGMSVRLERPVSLPGFPDEAGSDEVIY
jgi:hypothetical protein